MEEPQGAITAPAKPSELSEKAPSYPNWLRALRLRVRKSWPLRLVFAVLLLSLVTLALAPVALYLRQPHPVFATAKSGNIILTVSARGSVRSVVYSASFAISGVITQIDVVPGQRAHAGDTLATLDTTVAKAEVSDAQTAVSDAQTAVSDAQTALTDAQTAFTSAQTSLSTQQSYSDTVCGAQPPEPSACAAARAAVARAQAALDAAQARVDAAQVTLDEAQVTLDEAQVTRQTAQAQLAATTLVAPHDGIVLTVNGQVGDEIAPGDTPFMTLADTAQPQATVLVNYRDIAAVEPGESATLRVTQVAGASSLRGDVVGDSLLAQGSGDNLAYPVTISIDPTSLKSGALLPGMSASATITTRALHGVVTVPEGVVAYARQAAPANGKGLLTAAQIQDALQAASALDTQVISGGLDTAHDPPTATYLIGFENGKYVAIPVVLGLSDGQKREIIAGLDMGQRAVSSQRNPLLG